VLLSLILCFLMGMGAVSAEATDAERAGARSAATAGADAFDAGKFQNALDLFARAESLVHSPVHLSYIGQCQVKLGRLVEARETYLKLQRETVAPDAHDALKRALSEAGTHLEQIEPRLPFLSIKVEGAEPGTYFAIAAATPRTKRTSCARARGIRACPGPASAATRLRTRMTKPAATRPWRS
jgi:hypothetical protein